jgi:hypothetical protein
MGRRHLKIGTLRYVATAEHLQPSQAPASRPVTAIPSTAPSSVPCNAPSVRLLGFLRHYGYLAVWCTRWESELERSLRYYAYLSQGKVEMLYSQLPSFKSIGSSEIGFDFKLFKFGRKWDRAKETSLYERLESVEDRLYASESIGSLDEDRPWIYGRLPLMTTRLRGREPNSDEAIVFGYMPDAGRCLMMVGSAVNAMPSMPAVVGQTRVQGPGTDPHTIYNLLKSYLDGYPPSLHMDRGQVRVNEMLPTIMSAPPHSIVSLGTCEFVAKRLAWDPNDAVLATPLFVSMED